MLVGINDILRQHRWKRPVDTGLFGGNILSMLTTAKDKLPNVRIIVIEPFLIPVTPQQNNMLPDLRAIQSILEEITRKMAADYIGLNDVFQEACEDYPPIQWLSDGVHPTIAGHQLIADLWLRYVVDHGIMV